VRDAWGVDNPDQVELDAPGLQTVQRAGAAAQHHRHQADDELVEQTGLEALTHDRRPHEGHVLARSRGLGLRDGALDAVGDEGVGRLTCRHGIRDLVGQDQQRDAGHRAPAAPGLGEVVGPAPRDDRPDVADAFVEEGRADGRQLEPGVVAAGVSPSLNQRKSRSPPTPSGCWGGRRRPRCSHPGRSSGPPPPSSWVSFLEGGPAGRLTEYDEPAGTNSSLAQPNR
jgi:hypothetical protein